MASSTSKASKKVMDTPFKIKEEYIEKYFHLDNDLPIEKDDVQNALVPFKKYEKGATMIAEMKVNTNPYLPYKISVGLYAPDIVLSPQLWP